MASREWRQLRKLVFLRNRGYCERCQEQTATQVHHLTYERLGHEDLDDLQALCDDCHAWESAVDVAEVPGGPLPEVLEACVKCGVDVVDPVGRNEKHEWMCEPCATSAEERRACV
jgi:5-methylcytosine-specific restriction endonuclease McrA